MTPSVLVTRPLVQAQKTALRLTSLGIQSHIDPMLTVEYLPVTIPTHQDYQAILLTSAHAVSALQQFRKPQMIFTVGDATADAARNASGLHHVKSAQGTSQDLALLVEKELIPQGGPILYLSGRTIHFDLEQYFKVRGFSIDRLIAYETHPATDLLPATYDLLSQGEIKGVLFYSQRTAQTFAKIIQGHFLEGVSAFALSEAVVRPLRDLPFKKVHVAKEPKEAALIDKLQEEIFGK